MSDLPQAHRQTVLSAEVGATIAALLEQVLVVLQTGHGHMHPKLCKDPPCPVRLQSSSMRDAGMPYAPSGAKHNGTAAAEISRQLPGTFTRNHVAAREVR